MVKDLVFIEVFSFDSEVFECSPDPPEWSILRSEFVLISAELDTDDDPGDGENNARNQQKRLI